MKRLRYLRERPWLLALAAAVAAYLLLFVVLAVRRWMCLPPWSGACMTGFFQTVEAAVLFLWVEDWEALVGGMATFTGALIGAAALLWVAREGRRNNARALRAGLALKLGPLLDYAQASAAVARALLPQVVGKVLPNTATLPPLPELPKDSVQAIIDIVGVSSVHNASELSDLLHDIQVQHARLSSLKEDIPNSSHIIGLDNLQARLAEAVALYASVSDLYRYARREQDHLTHPLGAEQAHNALSIMKLNDGVEVPAAHYVLRRFRLPVPGDS